MDTKKSYQWFGTDIPPIGSTIRCVPGSPATELVAALAVSKEESGFHDRVLIEATEKINVILGKLQTSSKGDRNRVPALLKVPGGLFLAWTQHDDSITAQSEADEIITGLKLAKEKTRK
jgi:hypothetical protein